MDWSTCENVQVVGPSTFEELYAPKRVRNRVLRSHRQLKERGRELSEQIEKMMFVVIEVDDSQMQEDMPWCILKVWGWLH